MSAAAEAAPVLPSAPARPSATPRLRIEGLTHKYGQRQVLSGLSFEVGRGEIFGLLGSNGAGKTTAFHVLTGLLAPSAGRFELDGVPLPFGDRRMRSSIGVVFQGQSLDQKLSGQENLLLAAALHGLRGVNARQRVDQLLRLVELTDRATEAVSKYSGGMRRRLEVARALVHQPPLLVLDEPTSGLDETSFQRMWKHFHEGAQSGLSIVLTTHRPEEAEQCDRLGILSGGRLVTVDTPERIREAVSGDVISVEVVDPASLARDVALRFSCRTDVLHRQLLIECDRGHALIPRLVEAFPNGRLKAISLRRPSLADAFLRITGTALGPQQAAP
jgi:ABC-2 type transport system ATP-binding protein